MNVLHVQVACVEAAFPFAMSETSCVIDTLQSLPVSQMSQSLTPSCESAVTADAQSVVISGIPRDRVFGSVPVFSNDCSSSIHCCSVSVTAT